MTYLTSNVTSVDLSDSSKPISDGIDPFDVKLLINDINLYNLNSNNCNIFDSSKELSTITKHQLFILIDEYKEKIRYDSLLFINKINENIINNDIINLLEEFQSRYSI